MSRQRCGHFTHDSTQPPPPAPNPPTAAAPITLDRNSEARRAYRESRTAIALLQQRWPAAFPEMPQQVRPLIAGLTPLIAAAMDWSHPYTRAVLRTWKLRPAYCHAVLAHPVRFDLDGNSTDQPVDEDARTMAKTRLDTWASKRRRPTPHKPPGGEAARPPLHRPKPPIVETGRYRYGPGFKPRPVEITEGALSCQIDDREPALTWLDPAQQPHFIGGTLSTKTRYQE